MATHVTRQIRKGRTLCHQPINGRPTTSAGIKVKLVCFVQTLAAMHTAASNPRLSSVRPSASASSEIPATPVDTASASFATRATF